MPIYSCGDGTFRIGDGECMYTSRASVERAYVAYLAQEDDDKKAIDMNKVSFDFDDTLTQERWQNKAMMLKEEGNTVYIVTRRQEEQNDAVYAIADKIGVPRSRVYFTNGKMKWETIKRLGIGTHYDNNEDEIRLIRENTEAKGILVEEKSYGLHLKEETYNDYPEAATNNAKRVLKWKEEYGDEVRGMTSVGWNRANQLANKERLSRETIAKMAAFERHRKNAEVAPEFIDTPWRDNGHVAWLGWGGSAGIEWAQRKLNQIDNKKSMIYNYKSFEANVKDVDSKKGEVSGYFSAFGMVDSDGDIMMPGAFKRSIQDWGPEAKGRVKHLLNHDPSQPLGKIVELKEDSYGLYYRSQVGTHRLGQDFIKMVESGLIGEHSIGFRTLREQKAAEANEIHEVMLFEGSSLTAWGANEYTPILGIKSLEQSVKIQEQIKSFEKFIRNSDVTDETIELCLIKVRQLAQAIEKTSSTKAVEETPMQQKNNEELEQSLISILNKF